MLLHVIRTGEALFEETVRLSVTKERHLAAFCCQLVDKGQRNYIYHNTRANDVDKAEDSTETYLLL